jgi:hypothetical protein
MNVTHVVGIDPGLVHTGVVRFVFSPGAKLLEVEHEAIVGPDAAATRRFAHQEPEPTIFIEKYQPRSHFDSDAKMAKAIYDMKAAMPKATTVLNTGVKKVVRQPLMELLKVWSFPTTTNHQDLRSAARIALLGMLKQPSMNQLLSDLVRDHVQGVGWDVRH